MYTSNCSEDGTPRQKRRKVSISPPKPHTEDAEHGSTLTAEDWRADQEAIAPVDDSDMIDFNYNIDGLMYSEPSFAF